MYKNRAANEIDLQHWGKIKQNQMSLLEAKHQVVGFVDISAVLSDAQ